MSCCSRKKQPTETEVRKSAKEMRWGDRKSDLIWSAIWNTDTQKPEKKMQIWRLLDATKIPTYCREYRRFNNIWMLI